MRSGWGNSSVLQAHGGVVQPAAVGQEQSNVLQCLQAFTEKSEITTSERISLTHARCVLSFGACGFRIFLCVFLMKFPLFPPFHSPGHL